MTEKTDGVHSNIIKANPTETITSEVNADSVAEEARTHKFGHIDRTKPIRFAVIPPTPPRPLPEDWTEKDIDDART